MTIDAKAIRFKWSISFFYVVPWVASLLYSSFRLLNHLNRNNVPPARSLHVLHAPHFKFNTFRVGHLLLGGKLSSCIFWHWHFRFDINLITNLWKVVRERSLLDPFVSSNIKDLFVEYSRFCISRNFCFLHDVAAIIDKLLESAFHCYVMSPHIARDFDSLTLNDLVAWKIWRLRLLLFFFVIFIFSKSHSISRIFVRHFFWNFYSNFRCIYG